MTITAVTKFISEILEAAGRGPSSRDFQQTPGVEVTRLLFHTVENMPASTTYVMGLGFTTSVRAESASEGISRSAF